MTSFLLTVCWVPHQPRIRYSDLVYLVNLAVRQYTNLITQLASTLPIQLSPGPFDQAYNIVYSQNLKFPCQNKYLAYTILLTPCFQESPKYLRKKHFSVATCNCKFLTNILAFKDGLISLGASKYILPPKSSLLNILLQNAFHKIAIIVVNDS